MKRRWLQDQLADGSGSPWWEYEVGPLTFIIDTPEDRFQAFLADSTCHKHIGPPRKSREAAHRDCLRFAKKLRGELVCFGRAKL
jgi:hypothetical protein